MPIRYTAAALAVVLTSALVVAEPRPAKAAGLSLEADYIINHLQQSDGSIRDFTNDDKKKITPYFANYAIIGLSRQAKGNDTIQKAAWKYFDWYKAHQDSDGWIGDFVWNESTSVSVKIDPADNHGRPYDSVDSYAATYLMAIRDMILATGNKDKFYDYQVSAKRAFRAMTSLQERSRYGGPGSGLTFAGPLPEFAIIYAMDNAEVKQGLLAAWQLALLSGDAIWKSEAEAAYNAQAPGFESHLWKQAGYYSSAAYQVDPATNKDGGALDWRESNIYDLKYVGVQAQMYIVALSATQDAPNPGQRDSQLVNSFFINRYGNGSADVNSRNINCDSIGKLLGPYWLENAACNPLMGHAIANAGDSTDARTVVEAGVCLINNGTGRHQAKVGSTDCTSAVSSLFMLSSNIGQLMTLQDRLWYGGNWRSNELAWPNPGGHVVFGA